MVCFFFFLESLLLPERPVGQPARPLRFGERERAGAGGWHPYGGAVRSSSSAKTAAGAGWGGYKPSWRDAERRATHRARLALVARVREKRALAALGAWARHPCRSVDELLPPLESGGDAKKADESG